MTRIERGTLFLVVGPSGAGKDTLIEAVRARFGATHVFPKRFVTRPVTSGEDHIAVDAGAFAELERAGELVLSWNVHGLSYGIPRSIATTLARGMAVVVNVSRGVVSTARKRFAPVQVILVTAPKAMLAARLLARGRELPADVENRLERDVDVLPDITIVNDGAIEASVRAFAAALGG